MPSIEGNLALKDEYEETISDIEEFDDEIASQSESRKEQSYYLQANCNAVPGKDPSVLEPIVPFFTVKLKSHNYEKWWYVPDLESSASVSASRTSDTEAEISYKYTFDSGGTNTPVPEHHKSKWLEFCKTLFPRYREHTAQEREAYSEFIDSFFEEIEI